MSIATDKILSSYSISGISSLVCLTSSFTNAPNTVAFMCFFSEEERTKYNQTPSTSLSLKTIFIDKQSFSREDCRSIVTTCRLALLILNGKNNEPLKLAVCQNFSPEFPDRHVENLTLLDDTVNIEEAQKPLNFNEISIPIVNMTVEDYKAAAQSYINILGYSTAMEHLVQNHSFTPVQAYEFVSKHSAKDAYQLALEYTPSNRTMESKPVAASAATVAAKPVSKAPAPAKAKGECVIL